MSTDSTELTFVRCPSCRSLVPAVSTRCRMCGATLDSSQGKGEESEKDMKKPSRVRQRTMSQPESELSETAGKVREDIKATSPEGESAVSEPDIQASHMAENKNELGAEEGEVDDPLSAYIEEVEVQEGSAAPSASIPAPKPNAPRESHSAVNGSFVSAAENSETHSAESEDQSEIPSRENTSADQGSRVIVESGSRRMGKPSGLSFGKPREGQNQNQNQNRPEHTAADRGPRETSEQERRTDSGPRQDRQEGSRGFERREGRQDQRPQEGPRPGGGGHRQDHNKPKHQDQRPQQGGDRPRDSRQSGGPRPEEGKRPEAGAPRLFGWLVSYAEKSGQATELREGKFFISSSNLKGTDMVLNDPSISTPHALVGVHMHEGMRVQDLMSERGVFVRKKSGEGYQRVQESARLEHGDWVRFGDVEFLVCMVATGGSK